jgi:hypothetical protein
MTSARPSTPVVVPFEPTISYPDGDLILRSSDGIQFTVHKLLLQLGSDVFSTMLSLPQPGGAVQTVELSEDAETIDVLLRWIYPIEDKPTITSLDEVALYLPIALKYEIHSALSDLRSALGSRVAAVNPLRAYAIAVKNDCVEGAREAARLVVIQAIDVGSAEPIDEVEQLNFGAVKRLDALRIKCTARCGDMIRPHYERIFKSGSTDIVVEACKWPFSSHIYSKEFVTKNYHHSKSAERMNSLFAALSAAAPEMKAQVNAQLDSFISGEPDGVS